MDSNKNTNNAEPSGGEPSVFSKIANRFKAMSNENIFLFGVMAVTIAMIAGLTVGIVLSQNDRASLGSWKRAIDILESYPLVDGHNDYAWKLRLSFRNQLDRVDFQDMNPYRQFMSESRGLSHTDIKRIREGRLGAQFWAIYTNCSSQYKDALRIHMEQLDTIKRLVNKYSDDMELITTADGISKAFAKGKIASLLGLESGHAIDSSLAALRNFYRLGIRYMTLTHNCDTPWATNHNVDRQPNPEQFGGLSAFGRKVIAEMNRIGMMIDLSHVSHRTMMDALEFSEAPVIFSHSSVFHVCNQTRNVRDDALLKLKENNGIIMINFYTLFINCDPDWEKTDVSKVIEHIEYVKELIGIDHIGFGSDFDGVNQSPIKMDDVSRFPYLIAGLIDRGWDERDIIKVTYRNLHRVLMDVEEVSRNMSNVQPIDDFISYQEQPVKTCYSIWA